MIRESLGCHGNHRTEVPDEVIVKLIRKDKEEPRDG
jgi:hypothetical protein